MSVLGARREEYLRQVEEQGQKRKVSELINKLVSLESHLVTEMRTDFPMDPSDRARVFDSLNNLEDILNRFRGKLKKEALGL